jgi:hypothetical protein
MAHVLVPLLAVLAAVERVDIPLGAWAAAISSITASALFRIGVSGFDCTRNATASSHL